jgi:MFS family permease
MASTTGASGAHARGSLADEARTREIETQIPARLDRLPWARFHWMVIIGLGTVWILDGLEVTIVSSISSRLSEHGAGVNISTAQVSGLAATLYVVGACVGALLFGQLTDRYGRKRLFMLTLGMYLAATILTGLSFSATWFFIFRFLTGMGIGGEYSAINSAIDELIPARQRGRVDLAINGSYWAGAVGGALLAVLALNKGIFAIDLGWRLCFALGAVLGLGVLLIRRNVPESPRWLFIHGREQEAEKIVSEIEDAVSRQTGKQLPEPKQSITVKQRRTIPLSMIMRSLLRTYPRRTVLGFALFVGQAFLYNAILFSLGDLLSTFFGVSSGDVPYYIAVFAAGNLLGPLLLGHLFDVVGRKPMISGCYVLSGVLLIATALLFDAKSLTATTLVVALVVVFFFASAGASAAYLTVSEIFPLETRALSIAVFYAIGTGTGGAVGPLLFAKLIESGKASEVLIGFMIGAGAMILAGLAELAFGIKAERLSLEQIAKPLTTRASRHHESAPEAASA